jgi:hypothetical protein
MLLDGCRGLLCVSPAGLQIIRVGQAPCRQHHRRTLHTAAFSDTARIDGGDSAHADYRTIADQVSFDVSRRADLCFKAEDRAHFHVGRLHPLLEASGVCIAGTRLAAFAMSVHVGLAGGLYAHFLGILTARCSTWI